MCQMPAPWITCGWNSLFIEHKSYTNAKICKLNLNLEMGSSTNDITVLGGGGDQWFCDDSTKAFVIKRVTMGEGQKLSKFAWRHLWKATKAVEPKVKKNNNPILNKQKIESNYECQQQMEKQKYFILIEKKFSNQKS